MKNYHVFAALLFIVFVTMSFTNRSTSIEILISINENETSFGEWQKTDCLNKLYYKVEREKNYDIINDGYKWKIVFRNGYEQNLHFSCAATTPFEKDDILNSGKTHKRYHINANGGQVTDTFYVDDKSSIYLYINTIRLAKTDRRDIDLYQCDKK